MMITQNIKNDEEKTKDMMEIIFFSVFFKIPMTDRTMPATVRKNVIESPVMLPIFAILIGVMKTVKKQMIPMMNEVKLITPYLF